ncbi:transglutaminase-like domain-containing protein [Streptomyces catenulae]|uniref:Transglutaminase family protein n=1 Tax=Streptomyces catenulae TaxID=66875 RepID=A0ABV2YVU2_9ACTN|nr:transglutaminase family protein [Streptomyces catenulae]
MELIQESPEIAAYLAVSEAIDHDHPQVRALAAQLRAETADAYTYAKAAFEYVRDTVPHSHDADDPRVTWRASDVLTRRTGICFAKAHALTALLRAEGIPAALCYQRLDTLHGLIALRLPGGDWARQDPRGNKPGVHAEFRTDREQLAWPVHPERGEADSPVLYAEPLPAVLRCLRRAADRTELWRTLPTDF